MTQSRGAHPHEHLARSGRIELHIDDLQWPALRIRPRQSHLVQHGGAGLQCTLRKRQAALMVADISMYTHDS
jgi:hypothetical protein